MDNIYAKTFPGVYTQIIDRSFIQAQTSRFRCGLIGVARKGQFDVPTAVTSLSEFIRLFGQPLSGEFFLANAVAMLSDLTDGIKVVRVGKKSLELGKVGITTQFSDTGTISGWGKAQVLSPSVQNTSSGIANAVVYATLKQTGKVSTVNAQVLTVAQGINAADYGVVTFVRTDPNQPVIQDIYDLADVTYAVNNPAANVAESILYAYTYGSQAGDYPDAAVYSGAYQVSAAGAKNAYQFTLSPASAWDKLPAGTLIKLKQPGRATTHEVRVKQALPDGTVYLETTDLQNIGYQALPLQDRYEVATVHKMTGRIPFLELHAASAGDWANSSDITSGLFVKVRPGGPAGTKKFEIYEDGAIKETIDGLYQGTGTNSYIGRINNISQEITTSAPLIDIYGGGTLSSDMQPANYSSGYLQVAYPSGAYQINAGVNDTGGNFYFGANGEGATATDFIGKWDAATERFTGIQSFVDTDGMQIDVMCCPGITDAQAEGGNDYYPWDSTTQEPFPDTDTTAVHLKMVEVCRQVKALALIDIPPGVNARQAIDWHNGHGLYTGRGRIDSCNGSVFWNWFTISDPFTAQTKWVPPTLAALRCLAYTFDHDKPWYVAAGNARGIIPEAKSIEFERITEDTKQAMYGVGTGQSVNPIILDDGQIKLWGERTLQVAESKLSVNHCVILMNYVVQHLAAIGKNFVFEPNDAELLTRIRLAFKKFLEQVKTERGIEDYNLVIDESNNTPDTRNRREVIVNLAIVPMDSVERIFITATVNSSGADLKNATAE